MSSSLKIQEDFTWGTSVITVQDEWNSPLKTSGSFYGALLECNQQWGLLCPAHVQRFCPQSRPGLFVGFQDVLKCVLLVA